MDFLDFLYKQRNLYDKSECHNCDFKEIQTPLIGIPCPEKLFGVLISRDPTIKFLEKYESARDPENRDEWRYGLMKMITDPNEKKKKSPPQWLIDRIEMVNNEYLDHPFTEDTLVHFKSIMENNVYWTHIHKCCTENESKSKKQQNSLIPSFNRKNAAICSTQWLNNELSEAVKLNARVIICLGRNVEHEVKKWYTKTDVPSSVKVFYLPHPSTAANGVWYSKNKSVRRKLDGDIEKLLNFCQNFNI